VKIKDLTRFYPTAEEESWLRAMQEHLNASDHVIRLGEADDADSGQIVSRDAIGDWWGGRYIGQVFFEGHQLEIEPRLGMRVIEEWLYQALNLIAPPHPSRDLPAESFIALLMAMVWSQRLAAASRHGPPAFRHERAVRGVFLRGRLDVRRTLALRERGHPAIASVTRLRDLDNDVSRAIVCAERALSDIIGHDRWHTPRVREVLPSLREAVGARPKLPTRADLRRVRYSPITRPFEELAELSWRIAKLRDISSSDEPGSSSGLLLDVAELWELFVLNCARRALPDFTIEHGTQAANHDHLLRSEAQPTVGMGRLKPDLLVRSKDGPVAVMDAKYKRLAPSLERPDGVDRGDLYQLVSYLARFSPRGTAPGMLIYPLDPDQTELARAEQAGPWMTGMGGRVEFVRLPVDADAAIRRLEDASRVLKAEQVLSAAWIGADPRIVL